MDTQPVIREARTEDLGQVLAVQQAAFGSMEEAELVRALLDDASAQPVLSLLAFENDSVIGHILFTRARLEPAASLSIALLAPLAVLPGCQGRGVGGSLIEQGLETLAENGTDLVFVLGYPEYYSRHGFRPAGQSGFEAPYPIPEKNADAWMVRSLHHVDGCCAGKVVCADALNRPELWRE